MFHPQHDQQNKNISLEAIYYMEYTFYYIISFFDTDNQLQLPISGMCSVPPDFCNPHGFRTLTMNMETWLPRITLDGWMDGWMGILQCFTWLNKRSWFFLKT